jgi:hypothetical protein
MPVTRDVLRGRWEEALDQADAAYAAWCEAPRSERREAYDCYVAARDREDAAARALQEAVNAA